MPRSAPASLQLWQGGPPIIPSQSGTSSTLTSVILLLSRKVDLEKLKSIYSLIYFYKDQDGNVDVQDLVAFIGYMLGNVELSDSGLIAADFNGDGDINVLDVVQIVEYILTTP